ncbi:cytochrome c oxidase assembly protein [Deinococcus humi]|uniref:Cytochrome c oxidase assembly factor CtaG n=1 Tax=Deinococcus humi TaxID=662880 RepID=A0A7W8JUK0_9DEIO|nr:cytochrome c oxidase assembly protein [Deinococcus humi]MBB5363439.1 cytochrome c oxidase assembly factor CtaG [Deinococcus humi]GGO26508.1 hypothetical protein GCM10008949_17340 [Deinococcus humi]
MRFSRQRPKIFSLLTLLGGLALAHGGAEHGGGAVLWLPLDLALFGGLYALGLWRLWGRAGLGHGVSVGHAASFAIGLAVLTVALMALDPLADASFAWHMLQHLMLIMVSAPLLVLGSPLFVLGWAFPLVWRRAVAHGWNARGGLRAAGLALTHPVTVWIVATAVFWLWHVPRLYEAAVADERLHALEHFCFLATSAAFWWAVLQPQGRRRLGRGASVVYLFVTALQGSLLGALITFARTPLYPQYAAGALARGHDPLTDQQLAGLIMWVPSGVVYVTLAAVFFVQWWREEERFQRGRDAAPRPTPQGGQP